MEWSTACPDWQRRIVAGEPLTAPPLFPDEAESALAVFNALRIVDAPGCPTMGEACKPWIPDFVASVFGSYDQETGHRLMTEWLLSVSKKNFKSGLAAGIMLTALIRNWRESAEFGILAPTIEVANNSFIPARDMIRKDEELSDLFQVQDHTRTITHRGNGAALKVIAAENETVGGKKFTGVLVDELWLFGKRPNAEDMLREATGGLASRPEGFAIYLTTMSNEAPAGVFRQKLQYARGVRDGTIDDKRFVPVLYEFPDAMLEAEAHKEPKNFYITNPNLGASVDLNYLTRELTKAKQNGQESMAGFLAKHLNVEIGLRLASNRWAGADHWEAQGEKLTLDDLLERSEVVVVGIDGGGLDDLLGLAVMGRDRISRKWLTWHRAWAHRIVLKRRQEIAARLMDFVSDGDLVIVETPGQDVQDVADIVCRIDGLQLLPEKNAIGVDAAGIGDIVNELTSPERGIHMDQIIGISQGYKMNGAIKTAERKLAGGEMCHAGSALMAWCVGNAKIETHGNAILVTKQASGSAKIDPVMATFNCVSLMALNPASRRKKYQLLFA